MIIPTDYTPVQITVPDDRECVSIYIIWKNIYLTNQDTYSYISHVYLARTYNLICTLIKTDKLKEINFPYTVIPISSAENIEFYKLNNNIHLVFKEENILETIDYAGAKFWYKNGLRNRDNDLPAIISANGTQYWYKDGYIHRDNNLPAVICKDGSQAWYQNGVQYTPI